MRGASKGRRMSRTAYKRAVRAGAAASRGKKPGRKVTINDIAAATDLSKATVSLVLRNNPSIPKATRERVLEAAARLGYVYNRGAASLRSGSTDTVGLVVNDLTNPYFAEIVAAIQRRLTAAGRFSFLCNTGEDLSVQASFVEKLREYKVDGIILCPAEGTDPAWLRKASDAGVPLVLLSRFVDAGIDSVGPDNFGGVRLAMEHLIERGHQRIAMVGANERTSTGIERLEGYRKALKVARLDVDESLIKRCVPTRDAGFAAAIELMALRDRPTAIVCFNDILAFGVMLGLRSLRLTPGEDISVIGFDDIAEAALWRPALTTIAIPRDALAEEACHLLLSSLGRERTTPAARILLPTSIALRDTTAAISE